MSYTRQCLAGLLVVSTALLAGCGGGGSGSSTLSRSELISQADAICKRVNDKVSAANKEITSQQDVAKRAPELASFEHQEVAKLEALKAPSSISADWQQILSNTKTLADNTEKLGTYAKENNLNGAKQLVNQSKQAQQNLISITKRDGFKECSKEV